MEARDVGRQKVALIDENIKRCRLTDITAKCQDATVLDEAHRFAADVLIADLPVRDSGVLRRKTDIRVPHEPGRGGIACGAAEADAVCGV